MWKKGEEVGVILEFIDNYVGQSQIFLDTHNRDSPMVVPLKWSVFPRFHYRRASGAVALGQ